MAIEKKIRQALAGIALAVSVASMPAKAEEINPNGWPVPDVASSKSFGCKMKDIISEIPGKETKLCIYQAEDGTYFNSLSTNGQRYGFYVDTDGKPPMEYTLIDTVGDGVYRRKSTGEDWPTPIHLTHK